MIDKVIKLKNLLQTTPYVGLTADEQLIEVNKKDKTFNKILKAKELLKWAGAEGRAARLKKAAQNDLSDEAVQAAAYTAFKLLDRSDVELDLDDTDVVGLLDGLVQAGVLTAGDKTSLQNLANVIGSDAEKEGIVTEGGEVYLGHINQARSLLEV